MRIRQINSSVSHIRSVKPKPIDYLFEVLSSMMFCYHPLSAQTQKNVLHQAMSEIEEKTKVHGKTCIHFKPRSGEAEFIQFHNGTG